MLHNAILMMDHAYYIRFDVVATMSATIMKAAMLFRLVHGRFQQVDAARRWGADKSVTGKGLRYAAIQV